MPRSTRARVAKESQSQSQSQPQSLIQDGSLDQRLPESFVSASTASLPARFTISLATHSHAQLSEDEVARYYVTGAEMLADGVLKGGEGRLTDLRRFINEHRPSGHVDDRGQRTKTASEGATWDPTVLWYTVGYSHPCTCQLKYPPYAWSPSAIPPSTSRLSSLPEHPELSQIPLVGNDVPPWSAGPLNDLDSPLDDLPEFIHQWQDASGCGWGLKRAFEDSGCDDVEDEDESELFTAVEEESPDSRKRRKGKGKELSAMPSSSWSLARTEVEVDLSEGQEEPMRVDVIVAASEQDAGKWQDEAKKRKKWWRDHIRAEGSHGELSTIIPRPHSLEPLSRPSNRPKPTIPPDYVLPRFYSQSTSHPFHPTLGPYLKSPSRVYWAIPIVGPVLIPGYYDTTTGTPPGKGPIPSPGLLVSNIPAPGEDQKAISRSRSRSLLWTPQLLEHFWTAFLIPLHADPSRPFGALSVRISGPKPDPFLALTAPPPLPPWPGSQVGGDSGRPVRPEMGDHIRIYVDGRRALALRTWLNGIEVDLAALGAVDQADKSDPAKTEEPAAHGQGQSLHRPLEKVRLVLVGERGEALVVA